MMKYFSFDYVKKNPVMFGAIVIVFGLIVYLLLNKGSSGSGGGDVVYQAAGSDPAKLAAETQIAVASIQANAQAQQGQLQIAALQVQGQNELAIANLSAQIEGAALGAQERLGFAALSTQLEQMRIDATTSKEIQRDALGFQLAYQQSQNQMSIELSRQQGEAFRTSSLLSVLPSLKSKNRDEALALITLAGSSQPFTYLNGPVNTVGTTVQGGQNSMYALPPATIN